PAAPVFRISPAEPWRVVRTRQRAADPVLSRRLPPTELFAAGFFTSATGVTVYRGSSYPPNYRGNVFVGDVGGNLVHRKILDAEGPTYRAWRADRNTEFLASTDNWFRPVNFANTPDGTLLVIDMYRETIEHPHSIPEPIKKHLDLTSGNDRGRLYNLAYAGSARRPRPNLGHAPADELVRLLADPDSWWRETAQRLLFERQDRSVVESLRKMVKARPTALGRLHALWTLQLLTGLDSESIVRGLEDPEPRVREQAILLAEARLPREPELLAKLLPLAGDKDPMVRLQLAFSLGEANTDPRVIAALASIGTADAPSVWTRTAVSSSIAGRSLAFLGALGIQKGFLTTDAGRAWLDELAFLVGSERDPVQSTRLLDAMNDARIGTQLLMRAAVALGRARQRAGGSIRPVLEGTKSNLAASLLADAVRFAGSDGQVEDRLVAIKLLRLADQKAARILFPSLLDARQPMAVQLGVLQALGGLFDRDVARQVVMHWRSMSPTVRREGAEVLFSRRDGVEAVIGAIESRAILPSELDPVRLKELDAYADPSLQTRARKILAADGSTSRNRGQVVASY
ncbi:MAG TPA: HEAT repeat domain-containing protein, partial [Isosphaeraceae bacterium]|nr:HEAT repeat domain-containing protein [Isosphaeraceae bacterium]